jgi:hypothetical protein
MVTKLIRESLDEEQKKVINHYFKLQMRLKRHGSIDAVNKRGRKEISNEQKIANRKRYYLEVVKPRKEAEKQEKIKNGTYVQKKRTGRPRKNEIKEKEELINKILDKQEKEDLIQKILKSVNS